MSGNASEEWDTTCWTVLRGAAKGDPSFRTEFARLYEPVIRKFLQIRWAARPNRFDLDDAVQDVFLDCLKPDGALQRLEVGYPNGFRGYLFGITRNVARRQEQRRHLEPLPDYDLEDEQTGAETAFDRAWARTMMKEAVRVMTETAQRVDAASVHHGQSKPLPNSAQVDLRARASLRVELLRLRFQENLPIREIAQAWHVETAWLHHEYATARAEFHAALLQLIAFHNPSATNAENQQACRELLAMLH